MSVMKHLTYNMSSGCHQLARHANFSGHMHTNVAINACSSWHFQLRVDHFCDSCRQTLGRQSLNNQSLSQEQILQLVFVHPGIYSL